MALQDTLRRAGPFTGTGLVSTYPFAFKVFAETDVAVTVSSDPNGLVEETLKLNADYTVSLNEDQDGMPGGSITLAVPLAVNTRLTIISAVPADQQMELTNHDGFFPTVINTAFDKATALIQQLEEKQLRAVTVPTTYPDTPEELLKDIFDTQDNAHASATAAANSAAASAASASTSKEYADKVTAFKDEIVATGQNIESVKTNAQNIATIKTVADNAANITTVAGNIGSVQSVASGIAGVVAVAKNEANVNAVAANIDQVAAIGEEARQSQASAKASAESAKASEGLALTYKNEAVVARNETESIASGVASLDGSGVAQTVLDLIALLGVTGVDTNGDYMLAFTDAEGRLLFWIDGEGNVGWTKGVSKPVQGKLDVLQAQITAHQGEYDDLVAALASTNSRIDDVNNRLSTGIDPDNPDWLKVWTDSDGKILGGFRTDGSFDNSVGIPHLIAKAIADETIAREAGVALKVDKVDGKSLINESFADCQSSIDDQDYLQTVMDSEGRIIESIDVEGNKTFSKDVSVKGTLIAPTIRWSDKNLSDLEKTLLSRGFAPPDKADWSESSELQIPTPRCAVINVISDYADMPSTKKSDHKIWVEFWDMNGNYFKKRVIANAQGNSSLNYAKKNFTFDLCEDEWKGDETFSLRVGDWVAQDSFHIKAYWIDYFRGVAVVTYQLMDEVLRTRGIANDRPWKKALIDQSKIGPVANGFEGLSDNKLALDTGARCFPDGFPCIMHFNGTFYGIYSWQLKKHRDNMHQNKKTAEHIHLDGFIYKDSIFNVAGAEDYAIQWGLFEIRNPKNLICMDGSKYDGDENRQELIDSTSTLYNESNADHVRSAKVKQYIKDLSMTMYYLNKVRTDNYHGNHNAEGAALVREEFEKYFDPDNWIDYICVSDIIRNADGFLNNWQWTTWDGKKWYVNVYDVDMSFGGSFRGDRIEAPLTGHCHSSRNDPTGFVTEFYSTSSEFGTGALEQRYAELRKSGLFSPDYIISKLNEWTKRIGSDNYNKEFKRWPDCPSHGTNVIDETHWSIVKDADGNYIMGDSSTYDEAHQYAVGERCTYGVSATMGYYTFEAISATMGNAPISQFKYLDSIYRVKKWLDAEVSNMDSVYGYSGE